jgi:hypothetical protein
MSVTSYWSFRTSPGTFYIRQRDGDGHYRYYFEDEALEMLHSPEDCAFALASGACKWPSCGDPSSLGIPSDLRKWTKLRA